MYTETAAVEFTLNELWLLQHCIRHEIVNQQLWSFPPANLDLNDAIAEAILFCSTNDLPSAALILSWGDCLAIDATVPPEAKDSCGAPIGKLVLLKSYEARAAIKRPLRLAAECPSDPSPRDVIARLQEEIHGSRTEHHDHA